MIDKKCLYCGKVLKPKRFKRNSPKGWQQESPITFKRRKFCLISCKAKYHYEKNVIPFWEVNIGKKPWITGKKHTNATRKKMSEIRKANPNKYWLDKKRPDISYKYIGSGGPNWKGGITKDEKGYILVYSPNHLYQNNRKYVRRSHLVMEEYLGRYIVTPEVVHHEDKVITNDIPENLIVFANSKEHLLYHKQIKGRR